jgi:hypothetical protein
MKSLVTSLLRLAPLQALKTTLAVTAAMAVLGSGSSLRASGPGDQPENTQVAQILQLLSNFHGALSYGGDITAMMNLWADDSSITLNGVSHVGKAAEAAFFTSTGYFLHRWVSLAPEFKTTITVHGNTAEASTQCVAVDLTTTPMVVRSVIQVNATMVRHGDQWLFTSMDNTTPAPL